MESTIELKDPEDIPKIREQEIFTQGILSYCNHFDIPHRNNYNINFDHFLEFEDLYKKEKYVKLRLESSLTSEDKSQQLTNEFSEALQDILVAKNVSIFAFYLNTLHYFTSSS